jgi:putative oxidoreductase
MAEVSAAPSPKANWFQSAVNNRYVTLAFRLILAAIFLVSSYGKLVDIERYSVDAVYTFGILPIEPVNVARFFGLVMPFIELLCGLGLLFGVLTRLAALGVSLMSLAFFVSKAIVLSQGRSIECGCFGAVVDTLASVTIYMDVPMLLMGLLVMFSSSRHWLAIGGLIPQAWRKRLHLIW